METFGNKVKAFGIKVLNHILPKFDRIYLFSTFLYKDNIQAILDELLRNGVNASKTIYCDGPAFSDYHEKNIIHIKHGSAKSLLAFMTSKYVIYDIGIYGQIKGAGKQILVNTWHGTSLKKIEYYLEKNKRKGNPPLCTYSIAYSAFFKPVIMKAFGLDEKHVLITGEPRNDYLFSGSKAEILKKINVPEGNNLIIWMPTWRQNKSRADENDGAEYPFGIPMLNTDTLKLLNDTCIANNSTLIIKWHGLQPGSSIDESQYPAIRFLTSSSVGEMNLVLYNLVGCCDALITDYSSIYVNYLVLNRPICFAYDDIEVYKKQRGFMFDDVESIMPGKHVNTINGILEFISDIRNPEYLSADSVGREKTNQLLNAYSDNQNSNRLLKALGIIQ